MPSGSLGERRKTKTGSFGNQPVPVTVMSEPAMPCAGLIAICALPGAGPLVGAVPGRPAVLVGRPPPPLSQENESGEKIRTAR